MTGHLVTIRSSALVYGAERVDLDDPAELYHEASKAYPSLIAGQLRGLRALRDRPEVQASVRRAVRRNAHLPLVELPAPQLPQTPFADVVAARRSERRYGRGAVTLAQTSSLLHAAYGVTGVDETGLRTRGVPSGGGLYPLELYLYAARVDELEPGLYHFDPLAHRLERLPRAVDRASVDDAMVYRDVFRSSALLVLVSAVFWRSRFKYGQRGYRFVLLEAGHVMQNLLLAAAALDLAAVPLGGYFDRRVDELLALDGVNESTVYAACIGRRE
jgi:SagB-type dehydrogenase family enzyme